MYLDTFLKSPILHPLPLHLQNMWTRTKAGAKNELAEERRQKFKTGGGLSSNTEDKTGTTILVAGVCQDQGPLEGVHDNDHVDSCGKQPRIIK